MFQSVLSFILGFLAAATLALALAPILWRRAGKLMRRRLEASLPMSREELQAEIDAVKAEYAMAMRRLEMKSEAVKKKAAADLIEINRLREEVKNLEELNGERDDAVAQLETERNDLVARLAERQAELKTLTARLAETERQLRDRQGEVEELSRLYEEASLTLSTRQIELVSREGDIERLNDSISLLRNQRKDADRAARDALAEKAKAEEALRVEKKRAADLERRLEGMVATLSTREEKLERREKEVARLKLKLKETAVPGGNGPAVAAEANQETAPLTTQVADLSFQISSLVAAANGEKPVTGLPGARKSEVARLQSRIATLMRENKKLRAELAASASEEGSGDQALRERISSLAAEVVNLAATLDGPESPIEKALSQPAPPADDERPLSLADRVKALRETTPAE